jgi:hypothetical protein
VVEVDDEMTIDSDCCNPDFVEMTASARFPDGIDSSDCEKTGD